MKSCQSRMGRLVCAAASLFALPTLPLAASAAAAEADGTIEEVLVTGSRITRANLTQPNPVYGLDAEDIKLSGQTNVIDLIDDLPQLFSSQNGTQSDFFTEDGIDNTPGLSQLELRGLGANRTLVLVDGKRHVSGQAGSASVDVGTIPSALIEKVEVLTGGASAIYGADAVTGVVNFIMKDDFEGTQFDVMGGIADDHGGEEWQVSITHGMNLFDDRMNITISGVARRHEDIAFGDRRWSRDSGIAGNQNNNWRLFFQNGDTLPPGASVGDPISTGSGNACTAAVAGTAQALVDRACRTRPQAIERNLRFGLTSPKGLLSINLADDITAGTPERATGFPLFHSSADLADLAPGTPIMDFNDNGIDDCDESYIGAFAVGGCVVVGDDGVVRPFDPGIVDGDINFDAIGGDGSPQNGAENQSLDPRFTQYAVNMLVNFELTPSANLFADIKYVQSETQTYGGTISFEDTINISPENPFVPAQMRSLLNEILALNPQFADTAQFFMSRDPEDIHNKGDYDRETFRVVAGIDGTFWDGWTYELAFNYGRTEEDARDQTLLPDRYFAALDVVSVGGTPVCRSEVEAGWTVDDFNNGSIFGDLGVNTFTPGDGSCAPANPFGLGNISRAAQDFIAPYRRVDDEIEQFVTTLVVTGNTEQWFTLPAGAIEFALGAEYRDEKSQSIPDDFEQAGFYFNSQTSPVEGKFDVTEFFIEASVPIVADQPWTRELTVDGAYRYSDYSLDVGSTNTWSAGFGWAPIDDIRFRGTVSRAVRAPNIFELFSPQTQTTFNLDIDPCDATEIAALTDPVVQANRTANCAADPLVGAGFENPLTSNFQGVTGGNPELTEETSDTITAGFVLQPRWVDGLTITADWWQIEIEDAIQPVQDTDVLRGCYDGPALDPTFCNQFTRISDPNSGFFGGLNFLMTGQVNFAALETRGVDFEFAYTTDLAGGLLALRLNGTWLDELEEFRSALNPEQGDIETGEIRLPEWAGNFGARWGNDKFTIDYRARYIGNQLHREIEENLAESFNNAATGVLWIHDIAGDYTINERFTAYAGVQNFTDEIPFDTQPSYPTGPRGRYWYFGMTARL